jgi:hypothetical protein
MEARSSGKISLTFPSDSDPPENGDLLDLASHAASSLYADTVRSNN